MSFICLGVVRCGGRRECWVATDEILGQAIVANASPFSVLLLIRQTEGTSGDQFSRIHAATCPFKPDTAASRRSSLFHGQPFCLAHTRTEISPCSAAACVAARHMLSSQGHSPIEESQDWLRLLHTRTSTRPRDIRCLAHLRTATSPHTAAHAHVCSSHGHPFCHAACRTARCPFVAAS